MSCHSPTVVHSKHVRLGLYTGLTLGILTMIASGSARAAASPMDLILKAVRLSAKVVKTSATDDKDRTVFVTTFVKNDSLVDVLGGTVSIFVTNYYTEIPPSELVAYHVGGELGDDLQDFQHDLGYIGAGETKQYTFPITLNQTFSENFENYYVWVVVDAPNAIREISELNNFYGPVEIRASYTGEIRHARISEPLQGEALVRGQTVTTALSVEGAETVWVALDDDNDGAPDVLLSPANGVPTGYNPDYPTLVDMDSFQTLSIPASLSDTEDARVMVLDSADLATANVIGISAALRLGDTSVTPPNDIFKDALALRTEPFDPNDAVTDTLSGSHVSDGDPDWYKVFVTDPGTLTITLSDPNLNLGLYDQDGQIIATSLFQTTAQKISVPVFPQEGRWYYFSVVAPIGGTYPASYNLTVSYVEKYLDITGPVGGLILNGGDVLVLQWTSLNSSGLVNIEFVDREGNVIVGETRDFGNDPQKTAPVTSVDSQLSPSIGQIESDYPESSENPPGSGIRKTSYAWLIPNKVYWPEIGYVRISVSGDSDINDFNQTPIYILNANGIDTIDDAAEDPQASVSFKLLSPARWEDIDVDQPYDLRYISSQDYYLDTIPVEIYSDLDSGTQLLEISLDGVDDEKVVNEYRIGSDSVKPNGLHTLNWATPAYDGDEWWVGSRYLYAVQGSRKNEWWQTMWVYLTGQPNLIITDVQPTLQSATLNENVDVVIRLMNASSATSNRLSSFKVRLYINSDSTPDPATVDLNQVIEGRFIGTVPPTQVRTMVLTIPTSRYLSQGTKHIWAQIDLDDEVQETNENDNFFGPVTLTISGGGTIEIVSPPEQLNGKNYWNSSLPQTITWKGYGPALTNTGRTVRVTATYTPKGGSETTVIVTNDTPALDDGSTVDGHYTFTPVDLSITSSAGPVRIDVISTLDNTIYATGWVDQIFTNSEREDPFSTVPPAAAINNSPATATDITDPTLTGDATTVVSGTINSGGLTITHLDKMTNDYYKIPIGTGLNLERGGKLTVTITFDHDANDLDLELLDSLTNMVARSDLSSTGAGTETETISVNVNPQRSPYYIRVYGDTTDGASTYDLNVVLVEHTITLSAIADTQIGHTTDVTWTNTGTGSRVLIEYDYNGDGVYDYTLDPDYDNLVTNGTKTYAFTPYDVIPNETAPDNTGHQTSGSGGRIRIIDQETGATAESLGYFNVTDPSSDYIVLTNPKPGETIIVSDPYEISWQTNTNSSYPRVNLYFSADGVPATWTSEHLISKKTFNDNVYTWNTVNNPTLHGVIRIVACDASGVENLALTDTMDGDFIIVSYSARPKISLTTNPSQLQFLAYENGSVISTGYEIVVENGGAGLLTFTATSESADNWLETPTPNNGTLDTGQMALSVTVNHAGLGVNTYSGQITITDPNAVNSPQTVPVTLQILPASIRVINSNANPIAVLLGLYADPTTSARFRVSSGQIKPLAAELTANGIIPSLENTSLVNNASIIPTYKVFHIVDDVPVEVTLADNPNIGSLLQINPSSMVGTNEMTPGDIVDLTFTIDDSQTHLADGDYNIEVIFNDAISGTNTMVRIFIRILPPIGELSIVTPTLNFTGSNLMPPPSQTLTLDNIGSADLNYRISSAPSWINLSATTGTVPSLSQTHTSDITVNVDISGFTAGTNLSATMVITNMTTGDTGTVLINLDLSFLSPDFTTHQGSSCAMSAGNHSSRAALLTMLLALLAVSGLLTWRKRAHLKAGSASPRNHPAEDDYQMKFTNSAKTGTMAGEL